MLKNEKVEWKKLGEVCEFKRGKSITKKNVKEGNIPVIAGGQKPAYYHSEFNRSGQTITVAGSGAYAGFLGFWEEPIFLSDAFSIETCDLLNKKYLYYYLLNMQDKIYDLKKGSGIPHVYGEDMARLMIAIPSLKTQEKIAKTLDKFTNYVTELQSELQSRNRQYEYYRDKLLSEENLNKVLNNYDLYKYELRETTLGDLAQVNRGASPRPISNFITNSEDGVPWIKISDARLNSKYINQTMQRITREGAKKSRLLKKGDFIISNSMSYGRPYILAIEGCIHDGWASISEYEENLNSDFLYHYLNSNKVQNYWLKKMNTSSVSNLNSDIIKSLPIPLIDKNLQAKIAEILDKFQAITQDISGSLPDEIEKREKQYEYYREKLLTFDTERTRGGYQVLSNDYIDLLTQAGNLVGVKVFELRYKSLGKIGTFENGKGMPKSIFNEKGSVGAIHYGHIYTKYNLCVRNPIVKVTVQNAEKLKKVYTGDLVITKTSENIEDVMKTVAYLGSESVVTGGHAAIFRHKENPKYLSHVFNGANYFIRQKNKLARGVKVIELSTKDMEKIKILIPPLPIQEYIVSILDKFEALSQSTTEGLRREIELRKKQYEYYREKLLTFEK